MGRDAFDLIERYQQEVEEHYQDATYRIWAYYHDPEVTEFDTAPHDQQFQQAASYLDFAITRVGEPEKDWEDDHGKMPIPWLSRRSWSRHRVVDLIYGVALEQIISGAHLKLDTKYFLDKMVERDGQSPKYGTSKSCVLEDLRSDIPDDHVNEIEAVLDLARTKRHNLAHFGFHYKGDHNFSMLFVTVCGYLIGRYADTNEIPELETLAEFLDTSDANRVTGEIYPDLSIDFRPVS